MQSDLPRSASDALRVALRSISLKSFKAHLRITDAKLEEAKSQFLVPAHWMTLILAAGPDVRVTFASYHMTEDIIAPALRTFGQERVNREQAANYLKEFCNLTIGMLKIYLERNAVQVGVSLPISLRGFDKVFFPPPAGNYSSEDHWKISSSEGAVSCSVAIELSRAIELRSVKDFGSDEVEFF